MWNFAATNITENVQKISILQEGQPISYRQLLALWKNNTYFIDCFNSFLANIEFTAYFWESIPVNNASLDNAYQFVVTGNPSLAQLSCDPSPFANQFKATNTSIATFQNLGGDAWLVSPNANFSQQSYPHIAAFCRLAPQSLVTQLWQTVAQQLETAIHQNPIWLSTSGLGVSWVHIRIDTQPKYYSYLPYQKWPMERNSNT